MEKLVKKILRVFLCSLMLLSKVCCISADPTDQEKYAHAKQEITYIYKYFLLLDKIDNHDNPLNQKKDSFKFLHKLLIFTQIFGSLHTFLESDLKKRKEIKLYQQLWNNFGKLENELKKDIQNEQLQKAVRKSLLNKKVSFRLCNKLKKQLDLIEKIVDKKIQKKIWYFCHYMLSFVEKYIFVDDSVDIPQCYFDLFDKLNNTKHLVF